MKDKKEKTEQRKKELIRLTSLFSQEYLNDEYDHIIEKFISKMARKREVPFLLGRIEIWAAAMIHALGSVNLLFDKKNTLTFLQMIFMSFSTPNRVRPLNGPNRSEICST